MNEHKFSVRHRKLLKGAAAGVVVTALIFAYLFHALTRTPRVEKRLIATTTGKDWPRDFSIRPRGLSGIPFTMLAYGSLVVHFSRSGERFFCMLDAHDKSKTLLVLDGKPVPATHGKAHLYYGFFGDIPWWITYSEEAPQNRPTAITIGKQDIRAPANCNKIMQLYGNVPVFSLRDNPAQTTGAFLVSGPESYVIFNGKGLEHPYNSVDFNVEFSENGQAMAFSCTLKGDPRRKVVVCRGDKRTIYDADARTVENITLNYDGSKVAYTLTFDDGEIIMVNGEQFDNRKHLCVVKTLFSPDGRTLGYLSFERAVVPMRRFGIWANAVIMVGKSAIELGSDQFFPDDIKQLRQGRENERGFGWWSLWCGFSPDGRPVYHLLSLKEGRYIRIGNTRYDSVVVDGVLIPLELDKTSCSWPKFSPDGSKMAVCLGLYQPTKKRVVIFDMTQPGKLGTISDLFDDLGAVTFSPCGKLVAYAGYSFNDKKGQLFVNHKPVGERFIVLSTPLFSADSTQVSYGAFDGVAFWHCTAKVK